jgi:4-amino-4-deoxy-L-arabinose transferase-like glycosyltransferase
MMKSPWLWLMLLVLVLAVVTGIWVSLDRRPAEWDHANHLERALRCHRNLAAGRLGAELADSAFYPPLVPCTAGLLYFALPGVPLTTQGVMLGFVAIGLAAVFGIGRTVWDAGAGLLAAFLLGTAPFVVFSLMNFQLDLPLTTMVALTLWALLRTDGCRKATCTATLGVFLGLGMLTKPTFAVYITAPVLWVAIAGRRSSDKRGRRLQLLGMALLIAAAMALPWYGPRLVGLPFQVVDRSFTQAAAAEQAALFSSTWFLFYPRMFLPQFGLLAGLLSVWGLWALKRDRGIRAFLWLATLPALGAFSLIQNRNLRYTLPLLPVAALVATAGVRALRGRWQRVVVPACLIAGALQVSMAAFALPRPPDIALFLAPLVVSRAPAGEDWRHQRILEDLARASGGKAATVAVVPNFNFLSVSNLRYEAYQRGQPLRMTRAWSGPPLDVDFIVLKTGSQGPSFSAAKPAAITRAFAGGDPDLAIVFPVIAEYPLPDGSHAILRERRIHALAGVAPAEVARRLRQAQESAMADVIRETVGVHIAIDYEPEGILRGEIRRVRVNAEAATIGELKRRDRAPLRVRNLCIEVEDLLVNPHRLMHTGGIEVLAARAFRIERATMTQADLDALLAGQPIGAWLTVRLGDGSAQVRLKGRLSGSALVGVSYGRPTAPVDLRVAELKVGGLPIPGVFTSWVIRHFDPTVRLRNLPVPVSIAPIHIGPGYVNVGAS